MEQFLLNFLNSKFLGWNCGKVVHKVRLQHLFMSGAKCVTVRACVVRDSAANCSPTLFLFLFFHHRLRKSFGEPLKNTAGADGGAVCENRIASCRSHDAERPGRSRPLQRRAEPRAFTFAPEMSAGRRVRPEGQKVVQMQPAAVCPARR